MLKKILVAVDGSQSSWRALEYAQALAEKFLGSLVVVNVAYMYPTGSLMRMSLAEAGDEQERIVADHGRMVLELSKERLAGFNGKVEYILEQGHPVERILALANDEKFGAQALIIGSRGLSGIEEFFLGSVSSKVAERSNIPVLIAK